MVHRSYSIRNECQEELMHIDSANGWLHITNPKLMQVTQIDAQYSTGEVLNNIKFPFSMIGELIKTLEEIKGVPDSLI